MRPSLARTDGHSWRAISIAIAGATFAGIAVLIIRLGILFGVARAYPDRPWAYWLSPIADLPVVLRIIQFALRRRHRWRGRTYRRGKGGVFEPVG